MARIASQPADGDASSDEFPRDTVGLALSGGGIRSAMFSLGILQALAHKDRLRKVDFLSTISGRGYIGSFLGRLFTRPVVRDATDPCASVQEILRNTSSAHSAGYARTHASYLVGAGGSDFRQDLAALWGNYFINNHESAFLIRHITRNPKLNTFVATLVDRVFGEFNRA